MGAGAGRIHKNLLEVIYRRIPKTNNLLNILDYKHMIFNAYSKKYPREVNEDLRCLICSIRGEFHELFITREKIHGFNYMPFTNTNRFKSFYCSASRAIRTLKARGWVLTFKASIRDMEYVNLNYFFKNATITEVKCSDGIKVPLYVLNNYNEDKLYLARREKNMPSNGTFVGMHIKDKKILNIHNGQYYDYDSMIGKDFNACMVKEDIEKRNWEFVKDYFENAAKKVNVSLPEWLYKYNQI